MLKWLATALLLPNLVGAQSLGAYDKPFIIEAEFNEPTTRYQHGVFGRDTEYGALILTIQNCRNCDDKSVHRVQITLPENRVFEDLEPRVADLDGDNLPEVIVVETDAQLGAQLSVYGIEGLIAATPPIGQSNRWLAPAGIADLDGDGQLDIAYVETPHLGKTLRIWTMRGGRLVKIGSHSNLTNHRFGEAFISGGVRDCGLGAEVITANGRWTDVMATRITSGLVVSTIVQPYDGPHSFEQALACN